MYQFDPNHYLYIHHNLFDIFHLRLTCVLIHIFLFFIQYLLSMSRLYVYTYYSLMNIHHAHIYTYVITIYFTKEKLTF